MTQRVRSGGRTQGVPTPRNARRKHSLGAAELTISSCTRSDTPLPPPGVRTLAQPSADTVDAVHDVVVAGDGVRLTLHVAGYERPRLSSGADANWLSAEAELTATGAGSFRARRGVSLLTE